MFNQDITVINKVYDSSTKSNTYKQTLIKGFWSSSKGISINNTMLIGTDNVIVRILISESGYVKPQEFINTGWTLRNDDYLVKGKVESFNTLAELKSNYECLKITDVAVKDYGSKDMQHFEVSGE